MTFGDTVDAPTAAAMVDAALDAGITTIDTANGYAGGATEAMLGRDPAGPPRPGRRSPPRPACRTRRRRAPAAVRRGAAGLRRGEPAPAAAPTTSTSSICTSPTGRRRSTRPSAPGRARRRGQDRRSSASPTSPPGRSPTSTTRPTPSARRGRSSPSSSTTSWPAGSRRSTLEFATINGLRPWSTTRSAAACSPAGTSFEARPTEGRFGDSRLAAMYTRALLEPAAVRRRQRPRRASPTEAGLAAHRAGAALAADRDARRLGAARRLQGRASWRPTSPPPPARCPPTS